MEERPGQVRTTNFGTNKRNNKKNDCRIISRISDKKSFLSFFFLYWSGLLCTSYYVHYLYIIVHHLYIIGKYLFIREKLYNSIVIYSLWIFTVYIQLSFFSIFQCNMYVMLCVSSVHHCMYVIISCASYLITYIYN